MLGGVFLLSGICVAIQDALEAALTADLVPQEVRNLGYGVTGSVDGVGDFFSSMMVGVLWTAVSPAVGFGLAAALMLVGAMAMGRVK